MAKQKRNQIDPFFQQRNYFTVWDDGGHLAGTVFVLDTAMMPPRQGGVKQHDSVHRVRRTGRTR
jgi:hypothetical protein